MSDKGYSGDFDNSNKKKLRKDLAENRRRDLQKIYSDNQVLASKKSSKNKVQDSSGGSDDIPPEVTPNLIQAPPP